MRKITGWILVLAMLIAVCGCGIAEEREDVMQAVRGLAWPYYKAAVEVAEKSPDLGRDFTDHKTEHADMAAVKALEAGHAIEEAARLGTLPTEAAEGRVAFSANIDYMTLEAASLFHDTGMCGSGYALTELLDDQGEPVTDEFGRTAYAVQDNGLYDVHEEDNLNFMEVRSFHSLNSGLYLLAEREGLREIGFTDVQIDKMAATCMAHSKSNSGVRDLNSRTNWEECFLRLESAVAAWNEKAEHADRQISFDRTPFETDDALLSSLATETLALRIGDVSRDSGPDAEVQTGETVHVDRDTVNDRGGTIALEVENASIYIAETNDMVPSEKSRQVHVGEQNIIENHTALNKDGIVTHFVIVQDGCSGPRCTQQAVDDHLGEFYSARDGQFEVLVTFVSFEDEDGFFRDSWEDFRVLAAQVYPNLTFRFSWDEEAEV